MSLIVQKMKAYKILRQLGFVETIYKGYFIMITKNEVTIYYKKITNSKAVENLKMILQLL